MMVIREWQLTVILVLIRAVKTNQLGVSFIGILFTWLLLTQCLFKKIFILRFINWFTFLDLVNFCISFSKQGVWKLHREDLILVVLMLMLKYKDSMDVQILLECFCKEEEVQGLHYLIGPEKQQWINSWQLESHQTIQPFLILL